MPVCAVVFLLVVFGICVSGWATLENDKVDCLGILSTFVGFSLRLIFCDNTGHFDFCFSTATQWILLGIAEFLNAQFFLVAGFFVTKWEICFACHMCPGFSRTA